MAIEQGSFEALYKQYAEMLDMRVGA